LKWLYLHAALLFRALRLAKTQSTKKLIQLQLLHRGKVALSFLKAAKKRNHTIFWASEQHQELEDLYEAILKVLGVSLDEFQHDMEEADDEEGVGLPGDNGDDSS
jgi:hypothetical protein